MLRWTLAIGIGRKGGLIQWVNVSGCKELRLERVCVTELQEDQAYVWVVLLSSLPGQKHGT